MLKLTSGKGNVSLVEPESRLAQMSNSIHERAVVALNFQLEDQKCTRGKHVRTYVDMYIYISGNQEMR